jgi:hypothetical protein
MNGGGRLRIDTETSGIARLQFIRILVAHVAVAACSLGIYDALEISGHIIGLIEGNYFVCHCFYSLKLIAYSLISFSATAVYTVITLPFISMEGVTFIYQNSIEV